MVLLDATWLNLMWLAACVVLLSLVARGASRRALSGLAADPARVARGRRWLRPALMAGGAIAAIAVALARPAWSPEAVAAQETRRDVVFLVDVSKSMLAEDVRPSRLEHAKTVIGDAIEVAAGDRIGVVAFAGAAQTLSPPTRDYDFVGSVLDLLAPGVVELGGTDLSAAIDAAVEALFPDGAEVADGRSRDVFLLTDGEDHEGDAIDAAERLGELGVRLIAIGLGGEGDGALAPDPERGEGSYVTYQGERVRTRLDADTLRAMADATPGGRFIRVATGAVALDRVYRQLAEQDAAATDEVASSVTVYTEGFQWAVAVAIVLLLAEGASRMRRIDAL